MFPGVSWDEFEENWHQWRDYPCIYYTEEAFLAATDPTFTLATLQCDDYMYYWYNGVWFHVQKQPTWINAIELYIDVFVGPDLQQLSAFFANKSQQGEQYIATVQLKVAPRTRVLAQNETNNNKNSDRYIGSGKTGDRPNLITARFLNFD